MKVHHITPGHSDKNIGQAINELIQGLPKTDWVCLRDIDTLPMNHRTFFERCEEIARSGKYDLVGAMTNRSGMQDQLYYGDISNNIDLNYHLKIGEKLDKMYRANIKPCRTTIAGFFMLFSVAIWEKAGRFREGAIRMPLDAKDMNNHRVKDKFFDWHFCNDVKNVGGKIGIAQGIYIFHLYRIWDSNPKKAVNHLR